MKYSPKLRMWYHESRREKGLLFSSLCFLRDAVRGGINKDFALYPRRFYKIIEKFDHTKKIEYCFIGAYKIDKQTQANRKWIIDFIKTKFNDVSYLQFTDRATKKDYVKFGNFDYTLEKDGFVPKENPIRDRNWFDENYFKKLSQSKFTLCPAGDAFWSMRFYEALMCKSIPIVNNKNEIFRTEEESKLDYKYYISNDRLVYRDDWVAHNYNIFLQYHTREFALWPH
jgi:hypothetical protein